MERLRRTELVIVVPGAEAGFRRAFFVRGGRVAAVRAVPRGPGAQLELDSGLAEAARAEQSLAPEHADELLVVAQFLRRPPPELQVLGFDEVARTAA